MPAKRKKANDACAKKVKARYKVCLRRMPLVQSPNAAR